jgi:predicted dehydrogenase
MGYRQHLVRSLLAIRDGGGIPLADGTELYPEPVLVGRSEERLRAIAERHGLTRWTTSLDEVLSDPEIDVYFDTQVTSAREDAVARAIAAGKHVYTEKPAAVEIADLRRIQRAVRESGIVFACGHSARRLAGLREMKRSLEAGETGAVSMVEAVFGNERGLEIKPGDWRADPAEAPGGPLTQLGIHQIDNLQYLLGPAQRVMALGRAPRPGIANELAVGVLLEFGDSLGYLGCNWLSPGSFTIDVYGTAARLRYELDFSWWSKSAQTDAHTRLTRTYIASDSADPDARLLRTQDVGLSARDHLREEIEEFALAIEGTGQVEVGLDEAIANVAVLRAAARAMAEARPVKVTEIYEEMDG